jgi:uncharacterized protein (TIGR02246 family)
MHVQRACLGFSNDQQDRSAIADVVSGLERAWAVGDGGKWASYFADDADFTMWFGLYLHGCEAITDVHQEIFDTSCKSTKLRLHVRNLRFLRPDVALLHFDSVVLRPSDEAFEQAQFVPVAIMTKDDGRWHISMFHNTKDTVDEHLDYGDVRK